MTNTPKKISKIEVDRKLCIGAATCIAVSADAFELDNEGIAVVKAGALEIDDNTLLQAAQSCPTQAIYLYDSEGKRLN